MNRDLPIKLRFALALRAAINCFLRAAAAILWPGRHPASAASVCVYAIGNVGDLACRIPAFYAIRRAFPAAHLLLLTSPGRRGAPSAFDLIEALGIFDEFIVYHQEDVAGWRSLLGFLKNLRVRRFDIWLELTPIDDSPGRIMRNMLAARMIGPRWARGWRLDTIRIAMQAQSELIPFPDEVERVSANLARLGIPDDDAAFPLELPRDVEERAGSMLAGVDPARTPIVAIAPCAKLAINRWPVARYAEIGRRFSARGAGVVILGGPADRELCATLTDSIGAAALNLAGRCTVAESCAILKRCALLICNDSGVQHLAAAVGAPSISIFTARGLDLRWRPHGADHVAIRKSVPCHTCMLERCPYDNHCIELTGVDEVWKLANRRLALLSTANSDGAGLAARVS